MSNPFHDSLDQFRGRRVRATSNDGETLVGWVERVHHHDRHVVLRDARHPVSGERVGRALLSHVDTMVVAEDDQERVERVALEDVHAAPWSAGAWDASENCGYIRQVREEGWVGSYPVVRETGDGHFELVEGHKRWWVAAQAGLDTHPVAIVDVGQWEAVERFVADHFPDGHATESGSRPAGTYSDAQLRQSIAHLVGIWGDQVRDLGLVDDHMDRLGLGVQGLTVRELPDTDGDPDRYASGDGPEGDGEASDETVAAAVDDVGGEGLEASEADTLEEPRAGPADLPDVTDAGDPFHGEDDDARSEETVDGESSETESVDVGDLTPAQQDAVDALATHGELLASELKTVAELGGGMHHMLSTLVDDGVIKRRQDPDDGRRSLYSLPESEPEDPETGVDGGDETDDGEEVQNPYAPKDLGTLEIRERDYDGVTAMPVPRRVTGQFDTDRIHIRERDGRVEMAPGNHEDWPDYAITSQPAIRNRRVIRGMLDVVAGDEVRAVPDGDVVVLEPRRCAERDRVVDIGAVQARQYGRQKELAFPVDADRILDEPGQVYVRETGGGYEVRSGSHDDWPTYSQQAENSGIRLGAQALDLLGMTVGQDVRARGDRERGVIELAPPGHEFDSGADEEGSADDGAPAWRDHGADSTPDDSCENCGADLVDGYAAVFEPEDGDAVRCCPNCEDKVRERDGTVRPRRDVAGGEASD